MYLGICRILCCLGDLWQIVRVRRSGQSTLSIYVDHYINCTEVLLTGLGTLLIFLEPQGLSPTVVILGAFVLC